MEVQKLGPFTRRLRCQDMAQEDEREAVEAEGAEPAVGPEVRPAESLDDLGQDILLGGGAVLAKDRLRVGFERFANITKGAADE